MPSTFDKAGVITDPDMRDLYRWDGHHGDACEVCHRPWAKAGWLGLAVHHLIHGANGRSDEWCNLLLLCGRCHDLSHDGQYRDEETKELLPSLTLGNLLWVKSYTPDWDEKRLTALYHRTLPEWERLPQFYLDERKRWKR